MSYFSKSLVTKGDKEFDRFAYQSALSFYLRAHKSEGNSLALQEKIAHCYRLINDQSKAEVWYQKVIEDGGSDPENFLYYAQALESNKQYEEASFWYEKYNQVKPLDDRVQDKIKGLDKVAEFYSDSGYYAITPVRINSKAPDFSPAFYEEGIVFVSGRRKSPIVKKVFNWDNSSYLDLFYAEIDEEYFLRQPKQFNRRINTKYHEGPLAFYQDDSKVVFTRNNFYEGKEQRSEDDINKLKLYFAENNNGDWSKIEEFAYNDNEYSVGHPTINENGDFMIFASDMPGSLGETDLWYTEWSEAGWTVPKNLGPDINTEGHEMFPFLRDGNLYFASNGREGLGGLDIYRTVGEDKSFDGEVINLGSPINSSKDDFGYITKDGGRSGYFSSNRIHELYDDLYHFNFTKPRITSISGLVELEKDSSVIEYAMVHLLDSLSGDTIEVAETDRKGRFAFQVEWDKKYMLSASKPNHHTINFPVISTYGHKREETLIFMRRLELLAKVIAVDEVTRKLIPKPHIIVLDPLTGASLTPREIDVDTFEYVIQPHLTYDVAGAKRQYFTEHVDRFSGDERYGEVFWIVPLGEIELDKAIELEKIYYDLNKADIRPDAAIELDKLVKILRENPEITIELSSHTDSRGSDPYNKRLSQRRANSAVAYIISKGIASNRIVAKGYGEESLVNDCANDVPCTNEEHQRNRRTEFKVTSY